MYSLSVIVPVYNAEKYLPKALESLAAQTVTDSMQIILVDDGSVDASPAICDDFASKRPDTVVIHRKNGGVSAARNAGIKEADGEYVGFVDADDTVAPDYFEKLLNAAKSNNCDMAISNFSIIFNSENRPNKSPFIEGQIFTQTDISALIARRMLSSGDLNSVWSKIFRRSIINNFSVKFPEDVRIGEDKRFVLEFLRHCSSAVYAGDCGYRYFNVETGAMHSDKKMDELLATDDDELEIFVSLGLDRNTVREEKSAFLFIELADFLQRCFTKSISEAKAAAKLSFANDELMPKLDFATAYIKANNGMIYSLLATAFQKRSVPMTLAVLLAQKIINSRSL